MAGRPRANRASIKGTHLSIRLTEKEVATLDALLVKASAKSQEDHAEAVARWEQIHPAFRAKAKPEPPKPTTYADVVRALLQEEVRRPRLYELGFWQRFSKDTEALDYLVERANARDATDRWDHETMLRKLIEDEWKRRRLK